jgi:OOP family OmpA-OmpF porin
MKRAVQNLLFLLALAAGCAATPAAAQLQFGRMDTGLYLGGAVGGSKFHDACDGAPAGVSCDDTDTAWKGFVGYQFTRYIGAELGWVDFGKATASAGGFSAKADARGLELVAVASYPFTQQFAVYGKLGGIRSRVSITGPGVGVTDNSTDFTYGAGLRYNFVRNFAARLEWQRYQNVGSSTTGSDDIDLFSIGLLYGFY